MSMNDYIIEYEHFYHKTIQYDMKLLHTLLTFKLLYDATINEDKRKLAMTLGNRKSASRYIFIKSSVSNESLSKVL